MDFEKENQEQDWRKETSKSGRRFDFEAFLGPDGLDDRVTDVMDGRDLLEPDGFGEYAGDYVPRRAAADDEHGRHEAPAPEGEEEEPEFRRDERPAFDPSDPRYAAPERPHIVVNEPRPRVYVTPPGAEEASSAPPPRRGMSEGAKWAIAILLTLAIIGGAVLWLTSSLGSDDGQPRSTAEVSETKAPETPTPAADQTPAAAQTYMITVTAGSGGSINPSGIVSVKEGDSQTFAIVPDGGYEMSQLLVDGVSVALQDNYTFTNVTGNHTIYAVFTAAVTPTPPPTGTPEPTQTPEPTPEPTVEPTDPPPAQTPEDQPVPVDIGGDEPPLG